MEKKLLNAFLLRFLKEMSGLIHEQPSATSVTDQIWKTVQKDLFCCTGKPYICLFTQTSSEPAHNKAKYKKAGKIPPGRKLFKQRMRANNTKLVKKKNPYPQ